MRPVSARWVETINGPHRYTTEVSVISPAGDIPIPVLGGSVGLDSRATNRGTLEITVPHSYTPRDASSPLVPYGNRLRVRRGILYDDGTSEMVGLGVYRIESAAGTDSAGSMGCSVTGIDQSIVYSEAEFEAPRVMGGSFYTVTDWIRMLATELIPDVQMRFTETTLKVGGLLIVAEEDTYWDWMTALATSINCSLYFDGDGVLVLVPVPAATAPAVATIAEGEGGVLISASPTWDRTDAINRVVATGENNSTDGVVPTGVAVDSNPFSPTRYGGPFGRKTFRYSYVAIADGATAQSVAETILSQKRGISRSISLDMLPNPAMEPLDVVTVTREEMGVSSERHVIDQLNIPLMEGSITGTTRETLETT